MTSWRWSWTTSVAGTWYGLGLGIGTPIDRRCSVQTVAWFAQHSKTESAATSSQRADSLSAALSGPSARSPYHAVVAQRAPPEVPLSATISWSSGSLVNSVRSTPAVKAVWLPPPWHPIATVVVAVGMEPPPDSYATTTKFGSVVAGGEMLLLSNQSPPVAGRGSTDPQSAVCGFSVRGCALGRSCVDVKFPAYGPRPLGPSGE